MRKRHKPYPPKTPKFEVGMGRRDGEWFVGVKPPISDELLQSAGREAIKNWNLEDIPRATVLKSTDETTETDARGVGISLVLGLSRELGVRTIFFAGVVEMAPNTAPFQNSQPSL